MGSLLAFGHHVGLVREGLRIQLGKLVLIQLGAAEVRCEKSSLDTGARAGRQADIWEPSSC